MKKQNRKLFQEIDILKEEKEFLKSQLEELQSYVNKLESKDKKIKPKIKDKMKEKPIIKKTGLYDYILEALKNSRDFYNAKNHDTFESYLQSLQKPAKQLWESYRSSQVKVNYSEPSIQAAYLIRYYPHYVKMTFEIMKQCWEDFAFGEKINACFFGSGPCPEVAGLAQFLTEYCPKTKELFVNVYDIASEQWTPSRAVTKNFVLPNLWEGQFDGKAPNLDLCSANSFEEITEVIEKSHLFVFQNCLNEIWNTSATKDNIKFLVDRAPKDSFIIIADLLYDQNRQIVEDVAEIAEKKRDYKIIKKCDNITIESSFTLPKIVEDNLLTGEKGLIPKKKIKFLFLAIRKF